MKLTLTLNNAHTTSTLPDESREQILRLSENITEKTRLLTTSLKSEGLQVPTSDAIRPSEFPLGKIGNDDLKLREELIA